MVTAPRPLLSPRPLALAGLAIVLLTAGVLRLTGLNWDDRQHLHPDERFLTMVVVAERWPQSVGEYLNEARSPLNPRNVGFRYFAYGTLPTTLVKGLSVALGRTAYDEVPLVGRAASAVVDLGTLVFLMLLAQRLYNDVKVSMLAGALYAVSVLPIQHSHFFVVDNFATFFITGALWAVAGARRGRGRAYVIAGALFGLALACKASVLPFAVVVAAVALQTEGRQRLPQAALWLAVAGTATVVVFRLAQPDAFLGPGLFGLRISPRWLENLSETRQLMSGATDIPPGVQWANRPALLFSLENLVLWNMGPLLGETACVAVIVAAGCLVAGRERSHLVPVLWIALIFVPQATQFVKAGRYLLPIYPTLALLTAWMLVRAPALASAGAEGRSRLRGWGPAVRVLTALVCVGTLFWALAFTSVYRRPNSRVAASRWIYEHVPAGSVLATEYWDDALPLRFADATPERYVPVLLTNYDEDTPDKLATLVDRLRMTDYIVLSSNRLYDSIPRLPMRYPMTMRYYRLLFAGELGFEREAEFTSYPELWGLIFPDQTAEEAFSVYDHPRVQIFKKTPQWNAARVTEVLNQGIDWNGIVRVSAPNAAIFHSGQLFSQEDFSAVTAGGTWWRIFDPDDLPNRLPIFFWCLVVELFGLLAFPFTMRAFRELPDRGWLISKTVGLLGVSYVTWLVASLRWLTFGRPTLVLVSAVMAIVAIRQAWRRRKSDSKFWRTHSRLILGEEVLFWAAFALFLMVRLGNPDLWHPYLGGEKPMDFAYLNAVLRSEHFPPYDPWFAGGYINYYYFGFVLVGAIAKLTGIVPQVAYNLAIPTFFALTVGGVFTVGYALVSALEPRDARLNGLWPWVGGLMSTVFVTVLGNLAELRLFLDSWTDPNGASWPNWFWSWNATRVIPYVPPEAPPITEFPFFTFLYGDLHAHLLALPLTAVALVIAVAFVIPDRRGATHVRFASLALLGLVLGALYATNTWDYPTYVLVGAVALTIRECLGPTERPPGQIALVVLARLALVIVLGRVFFGPFFAHYSQAYGSVEWWSGSRTGVKPYLWIHGFFLFTLVTTLAAWAFAYRRDPVGFTLFTPPRLMMAALALIALGLSLVVEVAVMAHDISRMNTVFKFYFQVWMLWGVTAAVCATLVAAQWWARRSPNRSVLVRIIAGGWAVSFAALAVACAIYPFVGTRARWRDRFDVATGATLDGQAYMRTANQVELNRPFALSPDLEAIGWLEQRIDGTPVVAEAHTAEYRWGGRISTNTGLPTILGWSWHETQQRAALPADVVTRRAADVDAIFSDPQAERVAAILERYHVEYVYIGALERIYYPAEGLEKFSSHPERWQRVFQNAEVSIYRVKR